MFEFGDDHPYADWYACLRLFRYQYMNLKEGGRVRRVNHYAYFCDSIIGKGAAGKVYQGLNQLTGERVAVKIMEMSKIDNEVTEYLLACEKSALLSITNPYVLNAFEIVQTKEECLIVTPLCDGGTLKQYITAKGKLSEPQALQILVKLLRGYSAIKRRGFIHRDIKSSNVMFKKGDPVIIDFGYCEQVGRKKPTMFYNVGSPSYMSPEAYFKSLYSEKSDLWSFGIILFQMLEGFTIDHGQPIDRYFSTLLKHGFSIKQRVSDPTRALLKSILNPNFQQRPFPQQVIQNIEAIIFSGSQHPQVQIKSNEWAPMSAEEGSQSGEKNKISLKNSQKKKDQLFKQMLMQSRSNYQQSQRQQNFISSQKLTEGKEYSDEKFARLRQPSYSTHQQPNGKRELLSNFETKTNRQLEPFSLAGQPLLQIPLQQRVPNSEQFTGNCFQVVPGPVQPNKAPLNNLMQIGVEKPGAVHRSMMANQCASSHPSNNIKLAELGTKVFHSQIINAESILTLEDKFKNGVDRFKNEGALLEPTSFNQGHPGIPRQANTVYQSLILQPRQNSIPSRYSNPVFNSVIVNNYHPSFPSFGAKVSHSNTSQGPQPHFFNPSFNPNVNPNINPNVNLNINPNLNHHHLNPNVVPNANLVHPHQTSLRVASEVSAGQVNRGTDAVYAGINQPFSPVANQKKLMFINEGRGQENRFWGVGDKNFIKKAGPYFHMTNRRHPQNQLQAAQFRQAFSGWQKNQSMGNSSKGMVQPELNWVGRN